MHFSFRERLLQAAIISLAMVAMTFGQATGGNGNVRALNFESGGGESLVRQCSCHGGCGGGCGCTGSEVIISDDSCTDGSCGDSCTMAGGGGCGCLGCSSGGGCSFGGCALGMCGGGCEGRPLGEQWSAWDALTKNCDCACLTDPCTGEKRDSQFHIGGWLSGGYHENANGLFNNHPGRFNVHQAWLYAERAADPGAHGGLDWGFRADVVYGVDAQDTQSFGNNPGTFDFQNGFDHGIFGWAIPQAYAEIATENVSVIVGHFYTLIGYEVVTAPDNFFYSHAYTFFNSEPFTHTGVLATVTLTDNVTVYAGWTAGWDTGFDQFEDGSNFLGGVGLQLTDNVAFTYITTAGDFGTRGEGYSHSIVFDTALTDKLNWVFQSDLVNVAEFDDHDVGINQYLIYSINDRWGVGQRIEWWQDDGTSFNEYTVGLNYRPTANTVIRPEFRHDWSPATDLDQSTFGVDAIVLF